MNIHTSSPRRGTLGDPSVPFFFLFFARHFALSMGICRLPVHAVLCWSHMHAPVRNKLFRVVLLCKLHMHLCKLCGINVTARFIGLALYRVWKRKRGGTGERRERKYPICKIYRKFELTWRILLTLRGLFFLVWKTKLFYKIHKKYFYLIIFSFLFSLTG